MDTTVGRHHIHVHIRMSRDITCCQLINLTALTKANQTESSLSKSLSTSFKGGNLGLLKTASHLLHFTRALLACHVRLYLRVNRLLVAYLWSTDVPNGTHLNFHPPSPPEISIYFYSLWGGNCASNSHLRVNKNYRILHNPRVYYINLFLKLHYFHGWFGFILTCWILFKICSMTRELYAFLAGKGLIARFHRLFSATPWCCAAVQAVLCLSK